MTIRACALRSGSSGNSILVQNGPDSLVFDCGINGKQFDLALRSVGSSPAEISGLVISHEHRDHISGLGVIMRKFQIPVYITEKTFLACKDSLGKFDPDLVHIIEPSHFFSVGDTVIKSFPIPHDAVDPQAFRIQTTAGDIAICTDIGCLTPGIHHEIQGAKLIFAEANYDDLLLDQGPYSYWLKERIRGGKGHLSNKMCAGFLQNLVQTGTSRISLAHLSYENNSPSLAAATVRTWLRTIDALEDRDYSLQVAKRYDVSEVISL